MIDPREGRDPSLKFRLFGSLWLLGGWADGGEGQGTTYREFYQEGINLLLLIRVDLFIMNSKHMLYLVLQAIWRKAAALLFAALRAENGKFQLCVLTACEVRYTHLLDLIDLSSSLLLLLLSLPLLPYPPPGLEDCC